MSTSAATRSPRTFDARRTIERYALPILLVIVFVVFAVHDARFRSLDNVRVVLATNSVLVVLAVATIVPLIAGQFDLSVAAVMGTASIVCGGALSNHHAPLVVAILLGVGSGTIVGLFNGLLVTRIGVNSLIVTLGVATILPGLVDWYSSGLTIVKDIPAGFTESASGNALGIPRSVYWVLPIIVIVWFVLTQTPWGRRLEAIGSNSEAARLVGVPADRTVLLSFVASGSLAGFAGVLTLARDGAANPQTSLGSLLLPALAAVFLGATAFRPGHYNVPGTVVAVFFVAFSVSGLSLAGAAPWVEQVFNGSALVIAVTLSTMAATGRSLNLRRLVRAPRAARPDRPPPAPEAARERIGESL